MGSFHFDPDASLLEGNHIQDLGDRFQTVGATQRYSLLDLYLPAAAIQQVDTIRQSFQGYFETVTDGWGSVRTRLVER